MASNPLFNLLGGGQTALPANIQAILSQFMQFKQGFRGDPREQVQQMLNSGRITQAQYNQAVQMANELQKYLKP